MDIYRHKHRIEREKQLLKESNKIISVNKKQIEKFGTFLDADDSLSNCRRWKYRMTLRKIAEIIGKEFKKMKREDVEKIMAEINSRGYSHWTVKDYKVVLKRFFSWLYDMEKGEYPKPVKWIRTTVKKNHQEPIDVFSKQEIDKIINQATNIRDKAFFSVLYDAQSREGELLSATLKDVEFKGDGTWITLESLKSGKQPVKLYESVSVLSTWLQQHPFYPNQPKKTLWVNLKYPHKRLKYANARKIFLQLCKRAGVNKNHEHCRMHMFRKSRTTHLLNAGLPAEFVKRRGRWSPRSKVMESTYLKVTQQDVACQMDKLMGIKKEKKKPQIRQIELCKRCNVPLDKQSNFCNNCGAPISIKADYDMRKELAKGMTKDKDTFSEMIKNIVREEIEKRERVG